MLVFVAAGGGIVNAKFGGSTIPLFIQVMAPGMMVLAIILFMGAVSGAHLNPGVSLAFALRGDFPWRRVPYYIVAQFAGAMLATLVLIAILGKQGTAGLTLPGSGISTTTALVWEIILTAGLVSVILGTASGAQAIGWGAAIAVGSFIALAGFVGAPVSGASMNTARSLGPAIVLENFTGLVGVPGRTTCGALVAVGIAWALKGSGWHRCGTGSGLGHARGELVRDPWREGSMHVQPQPPARVLPLHRWAAPIVRGVPRGPRGQPSGRCGLRRSTGCS